MIARKQVGILQLPKLGALFMLVGCMATLAGCGGSDKSAAPAQPSSPAAPASLQATAGNAQVVLAWTASSGATSYHVKRATNSGGPYTQIAAPTSISYTDTALSNGTTYYYVASALDSAGESANSPQVSAMPVAPAMIPAVPTGVAAAAGNGTAALSWTASSGATGYHVKRATSSGGPYTQIAAPTSNSYTDTALSNGTTYYYVVSALDSAGESANSSQVSAMPVAPAMIPAVPTGVAAAAGNGTAALSWTVSSGATSYHVKRATSSGGPYTQIAAPASNSYTDTALSNGTTYYYAVSAVNSSGESANSAPVAATPSASVAGAVTGLHVSGNRILNAQNQPLSFHGVDKSGTEYQCLSGSTDYFDGPSDENSVTVLRSWAINIVRIPINEDCWLGINGQPAGGSAAAYQAAIEAYVNLLAADGIAAIIDLQWAAPGTNIANSLIPMPDADHAPALWASVANAFKANSSVIFDLFNEPYPDNNTDSTAAWTCILNGGTCPGVPYTAAGMQSLINTIRATGSTNIIMSPGVQYTNVLDQWLKYKPVDPAGELAASWHSYNSEICNSLTCWQTQIQPVVQTVPLIVGEIGEGDCQDTYVAPLMTWLDGVGGNYLAWAWNTYDCASFPSLISAYDGTPTAFGAGVRSHFLSLTP